MTWPFGALRPLGYRAILVDPPWRFELRSAKGEGKSPQRHYDCMPVPEIQSLPVNYLAAGHCVMVMWATGPMLPQAIETMAAWNFKYVTAGAWAKRSKSGRKWSFGGGYWLRNAAEFWLLGTVGDPPIIDKAIRNLIVAPVREHSRKPDLMYQTVERLSEGPFCELFARNRRAGWESWGNEVDRFGEAA